MSYLIVYGTFDGHTRKIAQTIADQIKASAPVRLLDIQTPVDDLDLSAYEGVIVAAPVHQQRHPEEIINFAKAHAAQLSGMRSALVSVSLAASYADGQPEAQGYVDRLCNVTAWTPTAAHLAGGALRFTNYDFFQEQIIRHVVLKDRAPAKIEGDQEFTDWAALEAFVAQFVSGA